MRTITNDQAELFAGKLRAKSGFSQSEPLNTEALLQKLNILTAFKPLSSHFFGLSIKSRNEDCFILINSQTTKGRQNFTIAHELYHLFYDNNPIPHYCTEKDQSSNPSEKSADLFASALLMPREGLLQHITEEHLFNKKIDIGTVIQMGQYYSVSHHALLLRLKKLNIISENALNELRNYPIMETAKTLGFDPKLYKATGEHRIIGDYGLLARKLFEMDKISEGHYLEFIHHITNDEN